MSGPRLVLLTPIALLCAALVTPTRRQRNVAFATRQPLHPNRTMIHQWSASKCKPGSISTN